MSNTETLELKSGNYEIREATMRQVLPLMDGDEKSMGLELVKLVVYMGGEPIGDAVLDLPFTEFQALLDRVNTIHGFKEPEKN